MPPVRVIAAVTLVAVGALVGVACGGSQTAGPSPSTEVLSLKLETAHFRTWADRAGPSTLRDIADLLEAELPRFSADLGATTMPVTTVEVWTDLDSYYADMVASVGRRYEGSTGYIVGPTNVTILARSEPARTASHELAHCVTMRVNPTIANNPRWLWESVATYENGDRVDPRTLAYLQAGSFPTLAQLDGDFAVTRQIYEVGFLIGEFIVAVWGRDGLIQLVLANGDVSRVFGIPVADFEQRWAAFVLRNYFGTSSESLPLSCATDLAVAGER